MSIDQQIIDIYQNHDSIAVYGCSRDETKPAHIVPAAMMAKGYIIIPINPNAAEILGQTCYPNLADIPERIDILLVFRPSEQVAKIVEEALVRKKLRGDIYTIWLQEGIKSEEGRMLAEGADIMFIQDRCMMHEHDRLMAHTFSKAPV